MIIKILVKNGIYKNSIFSDESYFCIAYDGGFPACSSVVYIKYTPSSQTKKLSALCDPVVNICF